MRGAPAVDWDATAAEATELLAAAIRIDTSNPPGNEYLFCDWLEQVLRDEGFQPARFDPGDGRHSIRASYAGDGSKRPILLLSHCDVVPCEPARWRHPPFAGVIEDGVLWGRGALDDKGLAVMGLVTLLLFKRLGLPSSRDLVFLCTADEEAGSAWGIEYLAREHPDALDAEYALNEGAFGVAGLMGVERPLFGFSPSEKGPLWLKLSVEGTPGHGSVPLDDNCVERLARALTRIADWDRPYVVVPEVEPLLRLLAAAEAIPAGRDQATLRSLASGNPFLRSRLRDGISMTTFNAGYKHNVIPGRAEATLDIRLLPGTTGDEFRESLRKVVDDPGVKIETIYAHDSLSAPAESELYDVFRDVVREYAEDAQFSTMVDAFFTDSRTLRRLGIKAYGFNPILVSPEEIATIHGDNERISLENIRLGVQVMFEVVRRMCAPAGQ